MGFFSSPAPPERQNNQDSSQEKSVQLADLLSMLETTVKRIDTFQTQMDSLNGRLDQVVTSSGDHVQSPTNAPVQEQPISRFQTMSEDELDALSRKDLLELQKEDLIQSIQGAVKELIEPIHKRVGSIEETSTRTSTKTAFDSFLQAKNPDGSLKYRDWEAYREGMQGLMKSKPGLTIPEAYTLAKAQLQESSPDEFKKIQEKYFPAAPEPTPDAVEWGGLRPLTLGGVETRDTFLDPLDAAKESYQEMRELHGGLPDLNG